MGTRVFVGHLNYNVQQRDLERFFKGYGRIREILLKNGFGFVEFEDSRDAGDAVYDLNGKELLGERVSVEYARGSGRGSDNRSSRRMALSPRRPSLARYGPPTRTDYRVIVENLSSRISWQDLKDYMRQAGEVTYADAHKDQRNEGVVEFASYSDMKNAINRLDNTELSGRRIKIYEDRSRSSRRRRSYTRSRSRSRSHRSSRSHSRSNSRSRSRSVEKSRKRSRSKKSRSESADSRRNGHDSRSKSPQDKKKKQSRSRSHSKSPSHSPRKSVEKRSRDGSREPTPGGSKDRSESKGRKSASRSPPSKSPDTEKASSPLPSEDKRGSPGRESRSQSAD